MGDVLLLRVPTNLGGSRWASTKGNREHGHEFVSLRFAVAQQRTGALARRPEHEGRSVLRSQRSCAALLSVAPPRESPRRANAPHQIPRGWQGNKSAPESLGVCGSLWNRSQGEQ